MRQAMQGKRPVYASDEIQREEAVRATLAHIQTREDITVASGETYKILAFGSNVYHVYDSNRPIIVDQSKVMFFDNKPTTTEVILQRPLKGIMIPAGM